MSFNKKSKVATALCQKKKKNTGKTLFWKTMFKYNSNHFGLFPFPQLNLVGHFPSLNISSCFVVIPRLLYNDYFNDHSEWGYTIIYLTVYLLLGCWTERVFICVINLKQYRDDAASLI